MPSQHWNLHFVFVLALQQLARPLKMVIRVSVSRWLSIKRAVGHSGLRAIDSRAQSEYGNVAADSSFKRNYLASPLIKF
uniref:Secreted protein n=1 Tax=Anguilla anguilla TaxID=7936 RepID=A0A0E9W4U6_ANGAN